LRTEQERELSDAGVTIDLWPDGGACPICAAHWAGVDAAVAVERDVCAEIADCAYPDGTLSTVEEMAAWIAGRIRARGHRQEEK